jgi:hypothetical protein
MHMLLGTPLSISAVCGNMNLPDIDWEEYTITGNQYKKVINKLLRSTIDDADLEKVINIPTRRQNSLNILKKTDHL